MSRVITRPVMRVGKEFSFEAAHSLPHLPEGHKCRRPHGHSCRFRVEVEGPVDDRGFVIDYAEIDRVVDPLLAILDHHNLNEVMDVPSTSENLAAWLHFRIARSDVLHRHPVRIVVMETASTSATYTDPKGDEVAQLREQLRERDAQLVDHVGEVQRLRTAMETP